MQKLSIKGSPKSDHKNPAEIELAQLERKLRTVELSLEILTGVCATLPDPEPIADGEEGEDESEGSSLEDCCIY